MFKPDSVLNEARGNMMEQIVPAKTGDRCARLPPSGADLAIAVRAKQAASWQLPMASVAPEAELVLLTD